MHFNEISTFRTVQHFFFYLYNRYWCVQYCECSCRYTLVIPFTPSADNIFGLNGLPLSTLLLYCIALSPCHMHLWWILQLVVPTLIVQECCFFVAIKKCHAALAIKKWLKHMHVDCSIRLQENSSTEMQQRI